MDYKKQKLMNGLCRIGLNPIYPVVYLWLNKLIVIEVLFFKMKKLWEMDSIQ